MKRSGLAWTIQEAILLYDFITSGKNAFDAEKFMGRSEMAFKYKAIEGGLCHEDLTAVHPFPSKISFIRNLRRKKKLHIEKIPPHHRSGKTSKLFNKINRQYDGLHSIPINKRYLVPILSKKACRTKHKGKKGWWKFSSDSQSNPYMRSQSYKKYEGSCAFCGHTLSEAEFQAHHSCYNHVCTFEKTIYYINKEQKKVKIPDCETCHYVFPYKFEQCLSKLHAVHGACNRRLYELEE